VGQRAGIAVSECSLPATRCSLLAQTRIKPFVKRRPVPDFLPIKTSVFVLGSSPQALVELGVKQHVDALENQTLVAAFHAQHALGPVKIGAFDAEQLADPGVEPAWGRDRRGW